MVIVLKFVLFILTRNKQVFLMLWSHFTFSFHVAQLVLQGSQSYLLFKLLPVVLLILDSVFFVLWNDHDYAELC